MNFYLQYGVNDSIPWNGNAVQPKGVFIFAQCIRDYIKQITGSLRQKQNARAKDNGERGPGRANVKSNGCSRLDIICSGR